MGDSINSDFFSAGFCSCKACIHAIHGNKGKEPERSGDNSRRLARQHGGYVQDVLYADFAGAKIGDAAVAKKDN